MPMSIAAEASIIGLHEVCVAHALGVEVEACLIDVAKLLRSGPLGKDAIVAAGARTKAGLSDAGTAKRIDTLMATLLQEVESMSPTNRLVFEDQYFKTSGGSLFGIIRTEDQSAPLPADIAVVKHLAQTASALCGAPPPARGRPKIEDLQIEYIGFIARPLEAAGLKRSNAGAFKTVCEAVFLAGGIPFPKKALRQFVTRSRKQ